MRTAAYITVLLRSRTVVRLVSAFWLRVVLEKGNKSEYSVFVAIMSCAQSVSRARFLNICLGLPIYTSDLCSYVCLYASAWNLLKQLIV